jgi:hypothetical protein
MEGKMANSLVLADVYTSLLDELVTAGLTTDVLTANAGQIEYNGGDSVKIAKVSTTGFGTYNRDSGYPAGAVTQTWETKDITMDRGTTLNVDAMDADETKNAVNISNVLRIFTNTKAIPEVDSYRLSKIFKSVYADTAVHYGYYTPAAATVLGQIQSDIADIQDNIGDQEPLICFISGQANKQLLQSTQLSKSLETQNITGSNGITTKVDAIDGVPLIVVPSARMKTDFTFSATDGFSAKAYAEDMNWIIMARSAVVAFVKHNKIKIFRADQNQSTDADKLMIRQYHDCWVYENKYNGIYVSLKTATVTAIASSVFGNSVSGTVTITLGTLYSAKETGHEFYYLDTDSANAPTAPVTYDALPTSTKINTADAVSVTVTKTHYINLYEVDANNKIVRYATFNSAA